MRYAQIRSLDISNGEGIGVSLFVQGCPFHCKDCFNQETWDFDGGKPWTDETELQFLELVKRPCIDRVSFLGGEPLAHENVETVYSLIKKIRTECPEKKIWLYTGFLWEAIKKVSPYYWQNKTIQLCDVVVDGQFMTDRKDPGSRITHWAGSTNQRVIDVQQSLSRNEVVIFSKE